MGSQRAILGRSLCSCDRYIRLPCQSWILHKRVVMGKALQLEPLNRSWSIRSLESLLHCRNGNSIFIFVQIRETAHFLLIMGFLGGAQTSGTICVILGSNFSPLWTSVYSVVKLGSRTFLNLYTLGKRTTLLGEFLRISWTDIKFCPKFIRSWGP